MACQARLLQRLQLSDSLASLAIQLCAVVTQPIVACALAPLILFDRAARCACAVVVIDTPGNGLIGLADGVEAWYVRHWSTSLSAVHPVKTRLSPKCFKGRH